MKALALALVLGLLGFVLGWFGAARAHRTIDPLLSAPAEKAPLAPLTERKVRVASDPEPRGATAAPPPDLRAVIARDFPPLERSGAGAIYGVVRDRNGEPQAGVELVAEPDLGPGGPTIRERLRHRLEREARRRVTSTDAEGRFAFEALPEDAPYAVGSRDVGLSLAPRIAIPSRDGQPLELLLWRGFDGFGDRRRQQQSPSVTVRVTLDGRPLERAQLLAVNESVKGGVYLGVRSEREWSAREPEVALGIGTWRVRAFLDAEFASQVVTVDPERAGEVQLELEPTTVLFGRLDLPPTDDAARLHFRSLAEQEGGAGVELFEEENDQTIAVRHGGFRLAGVDPGHYRFGLTLGSSPVLETWEVELHEGTNRVTLALDAMAQVEAISAVTAITVVVLDPEGRPFEGIEGFSFSTDLAPSGTRTHSERPLSAKGNEYRVPLGEEEMDALAEGRSVVVSVNDQEWGKQSAELVRGKDTYTLAYPAQAELEIVLAGYLGSGLEGALDVSVEHESEGDESFRFRFLSRHRDGLQPDWLGECRFRQLKPGRNIVEMTYTMLEPEGRTGRPIPWQRHVAELVPGANRVELPLPPLYELAISFSADLVGQRLRLSKLEESGSSNSPEDGRTIDGTERFPLPQGRYRIHAGRYRSTVELESDRSIDFKPDSAQ